MKKEIWICDICGDEFDNEKDYDRHCKECLKKNYKAIGIRVSPESTYGLNVRYGLDWHKMTDSTEDGGIQIYDWGDDERRKQEDYPRVSSKSHEVDMFIPRDGFGVRIPKGKEKEGIERLKQYFCEKFETSKKLVIAALDEIQSQIKKEASGENIEKTMERWNEIKKI